MDIERNRRNMGCHILELQGHGEFDDLGRPDQRYVKFEIAVGRRRRITVVLVHDNEAAGLGKFRQGGIDGG